MLRRVIIVLAALLVVSACGSPVPQHEVVSRPPSLPTVTVAYPGISGELLPLFVGSDLGLFSEEGTNLKLVKVDTGPAATSALVSGDAQVVNVSGEPIARAVDAGVRLVVIGAGIKALSMPIYGRRGVKPMEMRSIVSAKGGESDAAVRAASKRGWIPPLCAKPWENGCVTQVQVDENASLRIAAVKSKQVDATPIPKNAGLKAEKEGLVELVDLDSVSYPGSVIATTQGYLDSHRATLTAWLKGYVRSVAVIENDQAATTGVIKHWFGVNDSEATAIYKIYAKYFAVSPVPEGSLFDLVPHGNEVKTDSGPIKAAMGGG